MKLHFTDYLKQWKNSVAYLLLHKFVAQARLHLKANEIGECEQFSCEMYPLDCLL